MLHKILPHLNIAINALGYFDNLYELAERVTDKQQTFPGIYNAKGNYDHIDLDPSCGYHRIVGEVTTRSGIDSVTGNYDTVEIIYPMRFVYVADRATLAEADQYGIVKVGNNVRNALYTSGITTLDAVLGIDLLYIDEISVDYDNIRVWNKEFSNVEYQLNSRKMLCAIDYKINVQTQEDCLDDFT